MNSSAIIHRQVTDRAGNRIEPPPMATYCEPSQRAIIRARDQQALQRSERNRNEALALLRQLEMEEWLPQHDKESAPELPRLDPVLNAEFVAGLIADAALAAVVAGVLLLGDRL